MSSRWLSGQMGCLIGTLLLKIKMCRERPCVAWRMPRKVSPQQSTILLSVVVQCCQHENRDAAGFADLNINQWKV